MIKDGERPEGKAYLSRGTLGRNTRVTYTFFGSQGYRSLSKYAISISTGLMGLAATELEASEKYNAETLKKSLETQRQHIKELEQRLEKIRKRDWHKSVREFRKLRREWLKNKAKEEILMDKLRNEEYKWRVLDEDMGDVLKAHKQDRAKTAKKFEDYVSKLTKKEEAKEEVPAGLKELQLKLSPEKPAEPKTQEKLGEADQSILPNGYEKEKTEEAKSGETGLTPGTKQPEKAPKKYDDSVGLDTLSVGLVAAAGIGLGIYGVYRRYINRAYRRVVNRFPTGRAEDKPKINGTKNYQPPIVEEPNPGLVIEPAENGFSVIESELEAEQKEKPSTPEERRRARELIGGIDDDINGTGPNDKKDDKKTKDNKRNFDEYTY